MSSESSSSSSSNSSGSSSSSSSFQTVNGGVSLFLLTFIILCLVSFAALSIVSARAEDGLIEGVELPGKKFVLGIQWHPESLSDRYPEAQALFNAFVGACT